jgi:hypothetical protein
MTRLNAETDAGGMRAAMSAMSNPLRRLDSRTVTRSEERDKPLSYLLRRLNLVLQGWTNYFRHGACKATLGYLRAYSWHRVIRWL